MTPDLFLRRIVEHSTPPTAAVLYLAVFAALLSGYIMDVGSIRLGEWSVPGLSVLLSTFFLIAAALYAVTEAIRILSRRAVGPDLALALASGLVAVCLVAFRMHYALFREHLSRETLPIILDAISTGEVDVGWQLAGLGAGLLIGALAAALLLLRLMARARWLGGAGSRIWRWRRTLLVGALGFVALDAGPLRTPDAFARSLRERLPWFSLRPGPPGELAAVVAIGADGAPLRLSPAQTRRRFEILRNARREILEGPLRTERSPDILVMILESFRWDLVSPEIAPHLARLSERCLSPEYHFATGPDTASGVFGLLNGLSMFYYWDFAHEWLQPLPLGVLGRLGYERSLYRSVDLDYDDVGERFFEAEFDRDVSTLADSHVEAEQRMVERLIGDLRRRDWSRPHLDVVLFYATHWNYYFPERFRNFEPVAPESLKLMNTIASNPLREHAEGLKNRQRNAAGYADHLIGEVVAALEETGRAGDTVLVITGDHGEEFFERGRFGHTWGLNNEMARVPLLICLPEPAETRYRFSGHEDVFPTLFDYMGVDLEAGRFMTGKSLLDYQADRDYALMGIPRRRAKMRMAVVGRDSKVGFLPRGELRALSVRDLRDEPAEEPDLSEVRWLLSRVPLSRSLPETSGGPG
ncbi:MAG: sulfatase-like hydrolase/transferase [Myxococcota bacterium]